MKKSCLSILLYWLIASGYAQIVNRGVAYLSSGETCVMLSDFKNASQAKFINDGRLYFYADFTNAGQFDYYGETGKNYFVASKLQELVSLSESNFYQLILNNNTQPIAVVLDGNIWVQSIQFINGILQNRQAGGTIYILNNGTAQGASHQSFIDGRVTKLGHEYFVFPVGHRQAYRPIIVDDAQQEHQIESTYFRTSPNPNFPTLHKQTSITAVDAAEFWKISSEQLLQNKRLIALTYSPLTTPQPFIEAASHNNLVIVQWNESKQIWENRGGTVYLNKHMVMAAVDKWGIFTLGRIRQNTAPCPIEVFNLIELTAVNKNTHLRIISDCAEIVKVSVFNRWGRTVFETEHYGRKGEVFSGYANVTGVLKKQHHLPIGTYFYIIRYTVNGDQDHQHQKVGYLYLN